MCRQVFQNFLNNLPYQISIAEQWVNQMFRREVKEIIFHTNHSLESKLSKLESVNLSISVKYGLLLISLVISIPCCCELYLSTTLFIDVYVDQQILFHWCRFYNKGILGKWKFPDNLIEKALSPPYFSPSPATTLYARKVI